MSLDFLTLPLAQFLLCRRGKSSAVRCEHLLNLVDREAFSQRLPDNAEVRVIHSKTSESLCSISKSLSVLRQLRFFFRSALWLTFLLPVIQMHRSIAGGFALDSD